MDFFEYSPICAYVLIRYFCNKKFSPKERFAYIVSDLRFITQLWQSLKIAPPPFFGKKVSIYLLLIPKSPMDYFGKNTNANEEGFWALALRNPSGESIYQATFCFMPEKNLLIASIQGGGGRASAHREDEIRLLTKKCFGLRPSALLIEALKILTKVLKCNQTLGISSKLQIRSNRGLHKGYYADYDKTWQEAYGELVCIGRHCYYQLHHKHK
ncbi:hypothetical protein BKH46_00490 [Helicobacter sp. 12S02634-8]|nr:hypothetical protein BKH46_00490 [Helicobacter sp. 12S02634-8]